MDNRHELSMENRLSCIQTDVNRAIDRGLTFLVNAQEPDGHLPSFVAADLEISKDRRGDRSVFITQHIAASLLGIDDTRARQLLSRTIAFLEAERWPGGLWKFWTKDHPGSWAIPPDVDDTACVAYLLRCLGKTVAGDYTNILIGNRNDQKLFYTWILPRLGHLRQPRNFFGVANSLRHVLQLRSFFSQGKVTTRDLDAVVMTNVVLLLGSCAETEQTISWLHQVIREGKEVDADRYYQNSLPLYYAIIRCSRSGCRAFDSLKNLIVRRIRELIELKLESLPILDIALIVIVLSEWADSVPEREIALNRILAEQLPDGSWAASGFFFSAGTRDLAWGSEALTAGFCLEALSSIVKCND